LYERKWLRLLGSAGFIQDVRIGSFNTGSGAFLAAVTAATTIFSGMPFEIHTKVPPVEKDAALDAVIRDVLYREEVTIDSVDQGHIYSLGADILDIVDVRYYSDPERRPQWFKHARTASGNELRIRPALTYSCQLVIDAIRTVSLGDGDLATVNLPNDDWILAGAAARCWQLLRLNAPGKETGIYKDFQAEAARIYSDLSRAYQPVITRKVQLDEVW
jgi:hypothetical protein